MTFTDELWQAAAPVLKAIGRLPFLVALEDGSLPQNQPDLERLGWRQKRPLQEAIHLDRYQPDHV